MPQLTPEPWLAIQTAAWVILITVVLPAILLFAYPHDPSILENHPMLAEPWNWPWF
uniref:ATP synthase complex subunit 8 n=1 Tax=Channa gachua TaxID=33790 RepID=A0A343SU18_9TELE|nr:ATP synthase F0 subunit 8 [Channa gachua]AUT14031.1 ATP synthase F0 subunit 8 [Channa gachua]QIC20569.1 ATP synthase F0 subunit 8 [Channa gachua]